MFLIKLSYPTSLKNVLKVSETSESF